MEGKWSVQQGEEQGEVGQDNYITELGLGEACDRDRKKKAPTFLVSQIKDSDWPFLHSQCDHQGSTLVSE